MVFCVDGIYNLSKEYNSSFFRVELPPTTCDHILAVHNMKYLCQTVTKNYLLSRMAKVRTFIREIPALSIERDADNPEFSHCFPRLSTQMTGRFLRHPAINFRIRYSTILGYTGLDFGRVVK